MRLRVMLVDDEAPARLRLRRMLEELDDLEIVGEAVDGVEALERLPQVAPDLVFLDIEMPGLGGLELAARLAPPRPRIVFCTAYDQYAVAAFEQHAADYVLKPVNRGRLAQAVERVRRGLGAGMELEREVRAARDTQARLLPQRLPALRHLDFAGRCRPARGVGGDYYDFVALDPGRVGFALGDVAGKGLYAGLLMAGLQARIQALAPLHGVEVDRLLWDANRLLHAGMDANRYATLFYGLWEDETRRLCWGSAGHPPALVLRRGADGDWDGEARWLPPTGTVLGLWPDGRWTCRTLMLAPGDLLCAYSDGVSEAVNAEGEEFGPTRLVRALEQHALLDAERLADAVVGEVAAFAGSAEPQDDLTLVVARVR